MHYSGDLQLTGGTAVFMFDPATIPVMESDMSAQVCVELSGLVGSESLGCEVTITLDILEGNLASMLIHVHVYILCVGLWLAAQTEI